MYDCKGDKPIYFIFCSKFKNMTVVAVMVDSGGSSLAEDIKDNFKTINNTDVFDMLDLERGGRFWQCLNCTGKNISGWFSCIFCKALAVYHTSDKVTHQLERSCGP